MSDGIFDLVAKGRIAIKWDTAAAQLLIEGGRRFALLKTDENIPADIEICRSSWRQEVPLLDQDRQARIMDDRGTFRLYRQIPPSGDRNLACNG